MKWTCRLESYLEFFEWVIWGIAALLVGFGAYLTIDTDKDVYIVGAVIIAAIEVLYGLLLVSFVGTIVDISFNTYGEIIDEYPYDQEGNSNIDNRTVPPRNIPKDSENNTNQ